MNLKEKNEEKLTKERPNEVPVEEVLSVQEDSPSEGNSTSDATGKVEGEASFVEVQKAIPKENSTTEKQIEVNPSKEEPKIARVPEIVSEVSAIAAQEDVEETKSVIKEEDVKETVVENALLEYEPIVE